MSEESGKINTATMLHMVQKELTEHRYQHTLGVVHTAVSLAQQYGADPQKAEIAAILHDYAKFRPEHEMRQWMRTVPEIPHDLLQYNKELWHSFVRAYLVQEH